VGQHDGYNNHPAVEDLTSFRRHRPGLTSTAPKVATIARASRNNSQELGTSFTFTQRSACIHTTTYAQQPQQHAQTQHASPKINRRFRKKNRRKERQEAADADRTHNDNHDRNSSSSAEKAAAAFQIKETYSASSLSTSWTTPSVLASQHPAMQAVLQGVVLQQKSSRGSVVQAWATSHQSDEEEDEGVCSQDSDTENVELSAFDDEVVSNFTNKDSAFSEEVKSNNESLSIFGNNEEASEHADAKVEVLSSIAETDVASSKVGASNDDDVVLGSKSSIPCTRSVSSVSSFPSNTEQESSSLPSETVEYLKAWILSTEHIIYPYPTDQEKAKIMQDTGIELEQLTNWFAHDRKIYWPQVEARLQGKPYADVQVVSSITERNDDSAQVNSETAGKKSNSDFDVDINDAVVIEPAHDDSLQNEFESSSPSGGEKSDSPDDEDVPDSNAPAKSSSNSSKRKNAWYLPKASSATNENSSTSRDDEKEEAQF
jgi:hypothetical protein